MAVVRRPTSAPRLVAEAFVTALAVIALVWLAWLALWLLLLQPLRHRSKIHLTPGDRLVVALH
jgi:hypothetical protein